MNLETYKEEVKELTGMVMFTATFCGPCKIMKPLLASISETRNMPLIILDAEKDEVAQQMGVSKVPTMLIYKDGQVKEQILGPLPEDDLISLLEHHSIV